MSQDPSNSAGKEKSGSAPSRGESSAASSSEAPKKAGAGGSLKRYLPLLALVALMGIAFSMGWHKYLSFKTIALNFDVMKAFISGNLLYALLIYMGVYIVVVALSLPGGLIMTLTGGLLFGWQIGAPATIVAATIGATIIFLIAKTSFGETLAASAGPWLGKLRDGFKENALSYLLFLRLVPAFPFAVVNLAPALLGVPLRTYFFGTLFGIMPGTATFSVLGSGLGSVIQAQSTVFKSCVDEMRDSQTAFNLQKAIDTCPFQFDPSALVTKEILLAFTLMGVVALIPVAYKKWGGGSGAK